jgi:hypothetical protein
MDWKPGAWGRLEQALGLLGGDAGGDGSGQVMPDSSLRLCGRTRFGSALSKRHSALILRPDLSVKRTVLDDLGDMVAGHLLERSMRISRDEFYHPKKQLRLAPL